jgi:hypothetical protein
VCVCARTRRRGRAVEVACGRGHAVEVARWGHTVRSRGGTSVRGSDLSSPLRRARNDPAREALADRFTRFARGGPARRDPPPPTTPDRPSRPPPKTDRTTAVRPPGRRDEAAPSSSRTTAAAAAAAAAARPTCPSRCCRARAASRSSRRTRRCRSITLRSVPPIAIRWRPLSSVVVRCRPLSSAVDRCRPVSSVVVRGRPLSSPSPCISHGVVPARVPSRCAIVPQLWRRVNLASRVGVWFYHATPSSTTQPHRRRCLPLCVNPHIAPRCHLTV